MVSTTGMVVSLKTDLRFPESGQQGHGAQIIHNFNIPETETRRPAFLAASVFSDTSK